MVFQQQNKDVDKYQNTKKWPRRPRSSLFEKIITMFTVVC